MIGNPTRERGGVSFPKISLANASGCQQFRHCGIEPSFKAVTWTSNTFDPAISTALESHHASEIKFETPLTEAAWELV